MVMFHFFFFFFTGIATIAKSLVLDPSGAIADNKLPSKVPIPMPPKPYATNAKLKGGGPSNKKKKEDIIAMEEPIAVTDNICVDWAKMNFQIEGGVYFFGYHSLSRAQEEEEDIVAQSKDQVAKINERCSNTIFI